MSDYRSHLTAHPIRAATGSRTRQALYRRLPSSALRRSRSSSASSCVPCVEIAFNSLPVRASTTTQVSSGKLFVGIDTSLSGRAPTFVECNIDVSPTASMISINAVDNIRRCSAVVAAQRDKSPRMYGRKQIAPLVQLFPASMARVEIDPDCISAPASSWHQFLCDAVSSPMLWVIA